MITIIIQGTGWAQHSANDQKKPNPEGDNENEKKSIFYVVNYVEYSF